MRAPIDPNTGYPVHFDPAMYYHHMQQFLYYDHASSLLLLSLHVRWVFFSCFILMIVQSLDFFVYAGKEGE